MAIMIVHRDGSLTELNKAIYDSMLTTIDKCMEIHGYTIHEGINPNSNKKYIRKLYIQTVNYLKSLKSIIIKELSTGTSSHLQNTHFIELNLLRQTTYYKLNTTRP